jgi:adenylosuccinate lyase
MLSLTELTAINPIDGRYASKVAALRPYLSEAALFRYRLQVEIEWFIYLCAAKEISELSPLDKPTCELLRSWYQRFNSDDATAIKNIEKKINHDVKAVEYFLKEKMATISELRIKQEFVHFGCTSEDINNVAYALMWQAAIQETLQPQCAALLKHLHSLAKLAASTPMLARTHGQAASPTTLGKELSNYSMRLQRQMERLNAIRLRAKFNGAVGNYNAHRIAYPEIDWPHFNQNFIEKHMGLDWNGYTTQIEPHDDLVALLYELTHQNSIFIDLCQDMWAYISLGYFKQAAVADEVGSSTMPHKINPIDFENAEGNLVLANALQTTLAQRLPLSRWQRDLVDSTLLRNIGVCFAYSFIAYQSLQKGLQRLSVNEEKITADLNSQWDILAEAIQTIMRRYDIAEPYEKLKSLTRGKALTEESLKAFINTLDLPKNVKNQLLKLKPSDYTGYAQELALASH